MGAGIAQVCAQAGYDTHLVDANEAALQRGMQRIEEFWQKGIAKGKTTEAQRAEWRSHLHRSADATDPASRSQLVVEAVPEDLKLKQRVFAQVDQAAPQGALLASNTSSLSIASIAAATKRPSSVIGLHFFNPVPLMQLLEIVRHDGTSPDALRLAQEVGK